MERKSQEGGRLRPDLVWTNVGASLTSFGCIVPTDKQPHVGTICRSLAVRTVAPSHPELHPDGEQRSWHRPKASFIHSFIPALSLLNVFKLLFSSCLAVGEAGKAELPVAPNPICEAALASQSTGSGLRIYQSFSQNYHGQTMTKKMVKKW